MPTNRRPLARRRNPTFTPEILSLFVELENGSKRGEQFRVQERDLMYQLGLVEQFWTMNSVLTGAPCPTRHQNTLRGVIGMSAVRSGCSCWRRSQARALTRRRRERIEPAASSSEALSQLRARCDRDGQTGQRGQMCVQFFGQANPRQGPLHASQMPAYAQAH